MATSPSSTKNSSRSSRLRPSPEQIAGLAFSLYLKEGCPDGKELVIWFRAERMLSKEIQKRAFMQGIRPPDQSSATRATRSL